MKEITDIHELQNIEYGILSRFKEFCEEYNITFFLEGGTLIGAIRHNGFIPWDDDIDLMVPRPDYEKILNLFDKWGEKYNLKLVSWYTNPFFGRPMAKIIDTRTSLKELGYVGDDEIGVFIDLFPLDGVSSNKVFRFINDKYLKVLKKLLMMRIHGKIKFFLSTKKLSQMIEGQAKRVDYDASTLVTCYWYSRRYYHQKEWFAKSLMHKFEQGLFPIPQGYDALLKNVYGDYMKLPPEDERVAKHHADIYWK